MISMWWSKYNLLFPCGSSWVLYVLPCIFCFCLSLVVCACVCVCGHYTIGRESWIFPILFCEDNKTVDSIFVAIYSASRFFLHQEVFLQYPDHDTHRTGSLVHSFGINFITEVHIPKHNIALFCILFQIKGIKL